MVLYNWKYMHNEYIKIIWYDVCGGNGTVSIAKVFEADTNGAEYRKKSDPEATICQTTAARRYYTRSVEKSYRVYFQKQSDVFVYNNNYYYKVVWIYSFQSV